MSTESPLQYLPVSLLQSSPLNPRKRFDEARLQELADSFKGVGIIEPLVARPVDDHFEIVCGDRRSRAARLANLDTVPVIVKDLTDEQVLEIMVIENNQREDVNPLEEADGLQRLLRTGYDIDKMADRIGRSRKYIYDRVKLLDLVPKAKDLLLDSRFTAGHAILLARLKPEDQARALDGGAFQSEATTEGDDAQDDPEDDFAGMKPRSVRELKHWIEQHVRFDVQHMASAVPFEFGELADRVHERLAEPKRGKKVISITFDSYVQPDAREEGVRIFGPRSFKRADGSEKTTVEYDSSGRRRVGDSPRCGFSVLGVVVAGEHYGQAFDVCIARDKCEVHWKQEAKPAAGKKTAAAQQESRDAADKRYREQQAKENEERAAWEKLKPKAIAAFAAHVKDLKPSPALLRGLIDDYDLKNLEKVVGSISEKNLGQVMAVAAVLTRSTWNQHQFIAATKAFKFDLAKLEPKPGAAKPAKSVQTSAKPKTKKKAGGKKR